MPPEISVIIPAFNEEKYIRYPIEGLKSQTFTDFETIVVDGGSEDRTVQVARRSSKVIESRKRGVSGARNKGAEIAKGRIFLFLDADTKPSKGLLEAYHKVFSDKEVVAATGPIYPLEKTKRRINMGYSFVSILFVKLSIILRKPKIVGSNFAIRADKFRKSGGFNEKLMTYEDWDLSDRIKKYGKIRYSDDAKVYTSARRIIAWGISGYFLFYLINIIMYHVLRKTRNNYKVIR